MYARMWILVVSPSPCGWFGSQILLIIDFILQLYHQVVVSAYTANLAAYLNEQSFTNKLESLDELIDAQVSSLLPTTCLHMSLNFSQCGCVSVVFSYFVCMCQLLGAGPVCVEDGTAYANYLQKEVVHSFKKDASGRKPQHKRVCFSACVCMCVFAFHQCVY
jgi:hypothetical protein